MGRVCDGDLLAHLQYRERDRIAHTPLGNLRIEQQPERPLTALEKIVADASSNTPEHKDREKQQELERQRQKDRDRGR